MLDLQAFARLKLKPREAVAWTGGDLADNDDPAEATERLARALERIAIRAASLPASGAVTDSSMHASEDEPPDETEAEVSRRLDALITRIRSVLGPQAGG